MKMFVGKNTLDLMNAYLTKDEAKIKEASDRIRKEAEEHEQKVKEMLLKNLSDIEFAAFNLIDNYPGIKRTGFISLLDSYPNYSCTWELASLKFYHEDGDARYGPFPLTICWFRNKYRLLYTWIADDWSGETILYENLTAENVFAHISKLFDETTQ